MAIIELPIISVIQLMGMIIYEKIMYSNFDENRRGLLQEDEGKDDQGY